MEIVFTTDPKEIGLLRSIDRKPTGFAKEIRYLRENGITQVKFKNGKVLNLEQVDLNNIGIDWTE